MARRRHILTLTAALAAPSVARAQDAPGVSASEIRIGNTMPYSGPISAYGAIGRTHQVFFRVLNEQGGIAGRRITFITYDDGFSPPKTLEQIRRLVEQDRVAFLFQTLGTATNSAIHRYVNQRRVPHLFVATGADKWGNPRDFPWTMGWQPSYRVEAQIYAKSILEQKPNPRIAMLYTNDDFGKDYVLGLRDVLGPRYDTLVKTATFEVTDPTVDSQVVQLQATGADVLLTAAGPKHAAQAIRRVHDIGWKPLHFLTNVSISVGAVMQPTGLERGIGIITSAYLKDQTDEAWSNDPGMNEWRAFMRAHMPEGDLTDNNHSYAYSVAQTLMQVLKQCEGDFSRESVMRQAANLKGFVPATTLPGIVLNTAPDNFHPIRQMQLQRWTGRTWERFGPVIEGANV